MQKILVENAPRPGGAPALFALTGQSNISNAKTPLALAARARALGYATLLDAAALAPTSAVDLGATGVDAMAVSFYKMFGWPTGVGALVVREAFLERLGRPWFAGGTVDVVQAPGEVVTMAGEAYERFEVSLSFCCCYCCAGLGFVSSAVWGELVRALAWECSVRGRRGPAGRPRATGLSCMEFPRCARGRRGRMEARPPTPSRFPTWQHRTSVSERERER